MDKSWYDLCLPRIGDIEKNIISMSKDLKKVDGIKSVYIWGSFAENLQNKNIRVKDVDLLVKTSFFSEDLLSISQKIMSTSLNNNDLWDDGYDIDAINFSKIYTKLSNLNIDQWAISSDAKLMHWGAIEQNKQEADLVKQEAEEYANTKTGINKKKISSLSKNDRYSWYTMFQQYLNQEYNDIPIGWYKSNEPIKNIIHHAIKII